MGSGLKASCKWGYRGLTSWRSAVTLKSEAPFVVQLGPVGMMEQGTPADLSDSSITSGGGGVECGGVECGDVECGGVVGEGVLSVEI